MKQFSWEKPIENQILDHVRYMADSMEKVSRHRLETGWFANNRFQEDAAKMAIAYRAVERYIVGRIGLMKKIKIK